MTQQIWTFYDQFGNEHVFGIYHGEESGHFVAYLDHNILIIDFGILNHKTYTFFFEKELFHFNIQKKPDGFEYHLEVDKNTNTEFNKEIKKQRKDEIHIFLLIILILIAIFLSLYLRLRN